MPMKLAGGGDNNNVVRASHCSADVFVANDDRIRDLDSGPAD